MLEKNKKILIIGIGNEFRKDDAVGLHIAHRLKKILPKNFEVIETSGEGIELLELWKSYNRVYCIDVVSS